MKFLFVSGFQHLPQMYGGVMSNTHEIALELMRRGHRVAVAANLFPSGYVGFSTRLMGRLNPKKQFADHVMGYPTYRRWDVVKALPKLVETIRPDIAVVQPSQSIATARELNRLSVPVIVYFHDVLFDRMDGSPNELVNATFLANSEFTARQYKKRFGIDAAVIPPVFKIENYLARRRPTNVTFVNPQSFKGSDIALELVRRCPEIPFRFVESWELPKAQKELIRRQRETCPNLELSGCTMDMKGIYSRAKIVLIPSRLEEAWGRVVSEAQFSGIPVVASNRGGLPEAVGPGGILLDPDGPIEDWVDAVRKLWHDDGYYGELSAAALKYSRRAAINPDTQIEALLKVANAAIRQQHASQSPVA